MYEVDVWGIALDPFNQSPIVVLRNKKNPKEVLPIWIGPPEASGIMMVLNNLSFERPLTYELIKNMLKNLDAQVEKVEITDLKDGTYYAAIYLKTPLGEVKKIDSRPSDAINIALRAGAPIYVAPHVMEQSKVLIEDISGANEKKDPGIAEEKTKGENIREQTHEEIKKWLENLKPEDFQKFGSSEGN
ncbi:MAG TPA: bifunctional nuclease family protein [Aquifex aeolicus]|nr:bifunctional nuclease family protein [Aquificales bacterium]HIQ26587.1 bifunctional nuclease family protein [Aquifex aeolicus]